MEYTALASVGVRERSCAPLEKAAEMKYDYFYGSQADQFTFYRIPKTLFTDPVLREISAEAKILYGLLLDRMSLSAANGWLDDCGRVFIIYTIEEIMEQLGCAEQKTAKLLSELEKKVGLIERKRQGLGKPNLIYVKNFVDPETKEKECHYKSQILNCENHNSGVATIATHDIPKSKTNNTEKNNTDLNNTDNPFPSGQVLRENRDSKGKEVMSEYELYHRIIEQNLEIDMLKRNHPYETETLDEIESIILDTVCSKRRYIRIAGDDKPKEVVKSVLLKLNSQHIEFVLDCMKENTTRIRNIRQYLLAALYNAVMTISNYYGALVNYDMANGKV